MKKKIAMKCKKLTDWDKAWMQGFAAACAITLQNHGCDTIVEDTFKCNFMSVAKMKRVGVDNMDIEVLKPIVKEINRKKTF
jgi:hypothetical protein